MNIVVLDGDLNRDSLAFYYLQSFGTCVIYESTRSDLLIERAYEADILITGDAVLDRDSIHKLPKLRYIGLMSTGYDNIDINAAKERGIIVTNVPAYGTSPVAQLTFALLLELTNHAYKYSLDVKRGHWCRNRKFSYWNSQLIELAGLTMGIIGYGNIGKMVASIANAFGMNVLVQSRTVPTETKDYIQFVDRNFLFYESDVISLHCPLTPETTEIINSETLTMMKNTALLINTSRGGLVNEIDLAIALNNKQIAGAGLDVLSQEPPNDNNPLLTAKNCIITPHIGWATNAARERLIKIVIENVKAFLMGTPQHICS